MAGDWIKVEKSSARKPEVLKVARLLGVSQDHAFGLLVRFWCWLDDNCVDGVVDGVVDADVDALMSCPGLSALLRECKWATFTDNPPQMCVVNFDRHNGETSKNRALKSERQAKWRSKTVDAPVDAPSSTREEKKRKETTKSKAKTRSRREAAAPPDWLPAEAWERWRKHRGGKLTPEAVTLQINKLSALKAIGHEPTAMIDLAIESGWATFYPPKLQAVRKSESIAAVTAEIWKREPLERDQHDITGDSERVA